MGVIKTKGIIIAQSNMGDNDKMVTILTPDLGKIGCAAKGARKPKSNLMAGTQFLCFGDFLIYKGVNSYNINSCEPLEIFYNIRLDIDKLKYAAEVAKIINDVDGVGRPVVERVSGLPQLQVIYDRARLSAYGISIEEANNTLQSAFAGATAGSVFEED